ncbi:MAG: Lrp/AsnC family transcriptional regulator [Thaumarchaeota archaeon]|nr:Lrp/AsnC family transcriptional regulator [Nitrososphaerota archaeon]
MDVKDVRIFCEIAFRDLSYNATTQRHVSPTEIGRKIGLGEKTVRARITKMEEDGFIKYYQAMPSLSLFGLGLITLYRFEALNLANKRKLLRAAHEIPRIVEAVDYLGPTVSIDIAGQAVEEIHSAADNIARRFELKKFSLGTRKVRDPGFRMDRLDWQLIQKLRYDARMATADLAEDLGITPRMAEYRLNKMLDSGTLLIKAVINTQKQAGLVFYEMELSVEDDKRETVIEKLRQSYGEKLYSISSPSSGLVLASMFGFNLGEPEDSASASSEIEGVKYCQLLILKEFVEPRKYNWVDQSVATKLDA